MTLPEKMIQIGNLYPRLSVKNLGLLLTLYDIGGAGSGDLATITKNTPPIVKDQLRRLIDRELVVFFNHGQVRHYKLARDARDMIDKVFYVSKDVPETLEYKQGKKAHEAQ